MGRRRARCVTCKKAIGRLPGNRWFPFCSEHCKLIDLGRWLDGAYRIPGPRQSPDPEPDTEDPTVH
ncbi:MAG TPA: DNA gyrase inhibitor YacG [Acidobacteriota bacterium]